MRKSTGLLFVAPLLLAGCVGLGGRPTPQASAPLPAAVVAAPQMSAPAAPTPTAKPPPPRGIASRQPPSRVTAEPQPLPRLVGLTEAETVALLGHPDVQRVAAPGKVWQYDTGSCRLEVHLFQDVAQGGFRALDYTATAPDGSGADECLVRAAAAGRS